MDYVRDELKVYDPSMLQARAQGSQVVMHVFEKSVELPKHAAQREYYDPLQVRGLGQPLRGARARVCRGANSCVVLGLLGAHRSCLR